MIIFLLVLFVVLAFLSLMLIQDKKKRLIATIASFVMVAVSLLLITANMHDHFGMKVQEKTQKTQIYSAQENTYGVLAYQNLGKSGKEKVFIYKKNAADKKTTVAKPDLKTTTNIEHIDGNQAFQITKKKVYVYENGFYSFLFGLSGNGNDVKEKQVTYQVPSTWLALSMEDGAKLKAVLSQMAGSEDFISWIQANKQKAQENPDEAATDAVSYYQNILNTK
ncbi:DUF4811 domain-containing protein [Fructobacillus sp. M2-14]|uniref:DUF4811 domain-containing protein n=1 Tax=Fructobacillus broussonetiae TaxID=2713173 RepID=A0ABS5R211_9LACO|nr:DUF4811 domain-containing protein [Fructobacillus broussonetiae]MBS9338686.1 DUF4811 domain-containing protein [Fructobacillus broussonetiae]